LRGRQDGQARGVHGEGGHIASPAAHHAPAQAHAEPDRAALGLAAVPEGKRRSAASDVVVFTLATYSAQGLLFVAGLVQKGILGPVGTGFWSLMQTFWVVLTIAPLGALHGSSRQIPMRRGKREYTAAGTVAATGSSFSLLAVAAAGLTAAAAAVAFGGSWAPELRWGIVILGLTAPLRLLCDCHVIILQATKRFDVASLSTFVEATTLLTIGTGLVWLLGFYGMFAATVATNLVLLALWSRQHLTGWRRPAFRFRVDRRLVRELIAFGAPIMIQGQLWLLFLTVDNLIVASFLGVKDLGYYALAVSVTSYVLILPRSIGAALFPRMAERYAATESIAAIRHYATDVQRLLAYLFVPVVVGAAFFAVPLLIRHALPEFEPAISAVRIMVAGSFVVALMNMPTKVLITAGYRWPLVSVMVGCLAVNAAANALAVGPLDGGIDGAALATSASYLFTFVVLTAFALSRVDPHGAVVRHIGELLAVFTYAIAVLWAIESVTGPGGGSLITDAAVSAAALLTYLVALTPLAWRVQARDGTLTAVWSVVRNARKGARHDPA
jgi:O-antigen/teichoic acid export membrane protein